MANIADLIKAPELKSSKFKGLPLGSADSESGNAFLKACVQYLATNQWTNVLSKLPEEVAMFFRQSPQDPALGEGFAMSRLGHTFCWIQPSIKVGEQYKHLKPPITPVFENKDRADIKLQSSTAIETQQYLSNYNRPEVPNKLVSYIHAHSTSAIYNTINEMFNFFWLNILCAGNNKFIFDRANLVYFHKKLTGSAENTSQKLLEKYQEELEPEFKKFQTRAARIKNFKWYDPALRAYWKDKKDNTIDIKEIKEPDDIGNDQDAFIKKLYTSGGNTKKTPTVTRDMSVFAMLTKIRRTITEMTSTTPSYKNHVGFDSKTAVTENTELQLCRCDRKDLIVVVSEWDYDDLVAGVTLTGSSSKTLNLSSIAEGIKVIRIAGAPPGFAYVGETWILNLFLRLNHSGEVFHWREEEEQYYTNYWFAISTFTDMVCGAVIAPVGNYTAAAEFYEEYAGALK